MHNQFIDRRVRKAKRVTVWCAVQVLEDEFLNRQCHIESTLRASNPVGFQKRVPDKTGIDDRGRVPGNVKCARLPGEIVAPCIAMVVGALDRFEQVHDVLNAFLMERTICICFGDGVELCVAPQEQPEPLGIVPFRNQEQRTQIPRQFLDALGDCDPRVLQP